MRQFPHIRIRVFRLSLQWQEMTGVRTRHLTQGRPARLELWRTTNAYLGHPRSFVLIVGMFRFFASEGARVFKLLYISPAVCVAADSGSRSSSSSKRAWADGETAVGGGGSRQQCVPTLDRIVP